MNQFIFDFFFYLKYIFLLTFSPGIMTATLTYTLVLAAIYLGRKAIQTIEENPTQALNMFYLSATAIFYVININRSDLKILNN